jgi:Zn-finger nucleic acid-binding protein
VKCAKCPGTLEHLRQGDLELDRCSRCQGIFFDPGELTKIFDDSDARTIREEISRIPESADERPATCPRCGWTMTRVATEKLAYDVCLPCNGVWLDAGELSSLDEEHTSRRSRPPAARDRIRKLGESVRKFFEDELSEINRTKARRLVRLTRLRQQGLLPADEFDRIRKEIERNAAASQEAALEGGLLRDVDRLRADGFLSEAEYKRLRKRILKK